MKEFKGYKEHNEKREQVLSGFYRLFQVLNDSTKKDAGIEHAGMEYTYHNGKGDLAEKKILDLYKVVVLSDLSLATLIKEYDKLLH